VRGAGSATAVATFVKLGEARHFPEPLRAGTQDVVARRRVLAGYMNKTALHGLAEEPPVPPVKILPGARVLLLVICLPKIDLLARPKDSALSGRYIRRHRPQAQSHTERIDAERGPKGKLANPVLSGMTGGAQRYRVAIARLYPNASIGSRTNMRGFRWCCFAAGDAGELPNISQVPYPPAQISLGFARRQDAGDTGSGH
jgi:hypothetical protein